MPQELLQQDQPVVLTANVSYSIPGGANIVAWQSVAGSDLLGSLDNSTFSSLGVSAANEVKSLLTGTLFVKTATANTTVVIRKASASVISAGNLGSTLTFPLGTTLAESVLGKLTLAGITSPMFQIGGNTASFVALKRNSAVLEGRLADDSNYCNFQALSCLATVFCHAGNGSSITAGGTNAYGLRMSTVSNFGIYCGSGVPTLSAAQGSIYMRSDGSSTTTRAYINTDGGTTWTAISTVA